MSRKLSSVNGFVVYETTSVGDTLHNSEGDGLSIETEEALATLRSGEMPSKGVKKKAAPKEKSAPAEE